MYPAKKAEIYDVFPRENREKKEAFLPYLHTLRAFAIVCVVMAHIWKFPKTYQSWEITESLFNIRRMAFNGSTIYFLFLSGFLLSHLRKNSNTGNYYKRILLHVAAPYLCFSAAALSIQHFLQGKSFGIITLFRRILLGTTHSAYWYVPFVLVLFAFSPALRKLPDRALLRIALGLALLPLLGTRTDTQITLWQYLYFAPVYFLGMAVARNRGFFENFAEKSRWWLLGVCLLSSYFLLRMDNPFQWGRMNIGASLQYLHKISLCFLAIHYFKRFTPKKGGLVDLLAVYSFSLYFIHKIIHELVMEKFYGWVQPSSKGLLPLSILYCIALFGICLISCVGLKKVSGRYSRIFMGA